MDSTPSEKFSATKLCVHFKIVNSSTQLPIPVSEMETRRVGQKEAEEDRFTEIDTLQRLWDNQHRLIADETKCSERLRFDEISIRFKTLICSQLSALLLLGFTHSLLRTTESGGSISRVCEMKRGTCLKFETPIGDSISRIRFAPGSNNLLITSWDSSLRLYDVEESVVRLEAAGNAALLDCCFENESVCVASGCDGSITRYDVHSEVRTLVGRHDDLATCVEYSVETGELLSAGWDKTVRFWDHRFTDATRPFKDVGDAVNSMSLSSFSLKIAVGKSVHVYDLRYLDQPVQSTESCKGSPIRCVRSFSDSKGFFTGSLDGLVTLEIVQSSALLDKPYAFRCCPKSKDGKKYLTAINDIAFHPGFSGTFVTGSNDGYVIGWNAQAKKRQFELPRYPNSVAGLSYNYDGQLLAVAMSHTYQAAIESEEEPQIFIQAMDNTIIGSMSVGSSIRR